MSPADAGRAHRRAQPRLRTVERAATLIEIPVDYNGEDLDEVAQMLGISRDEVIRRHTGSEYTVAFTGFAPGFAYLSGGDPASTCRVAPRRARAFRPVPWGWQGPSAASIRRPARAAGRSSA